MYYPEFLTETNLYTNGGEYSLAATGEAYIGFYWKTFDGKYYTNKNPQQTPYQLLVLTQTIQSQNNGDSFIQPSPGYPKNDLNQNIVPNPTPYSPKPSPGDYENGFFFRYFSKPVNSDSYIEINQITYGLMIEKRSNINYQLNTSLSVRWILTGGPQDSVYNQNKLIVEYMEVKSPFKYLGQFLKFNYSKFYQG